MKKKDDWEVAAPVGKFNLIAYKEREGRMGWKTYIPYVLDYKDEEGMLYWLYPESIKRGEYEIREADESLTNFTYVQFYCIDCSPKFGALCRVEFQQNGGTGYATLYESRERVCYACCAERDKKHMKEKGEIALYLSDDGAMSSARVGNWAGTLNYKVVRYSRSKHNIAGVRYDVWFRDDDGALWWGVNYGHNSQLTRCRRLKRQRII